MKNEFDVVVSGAGPVGLMLAIELALHGARVLVLERLATPSTVSKALALGPLGVEALQRRGMAAPVAAAAERAMAAMRAAAAQTGAPQRGAGGKYIGHFGGLSLIRADAQLEPQRRAQPVDQQAVEAMLAERAAALGIDVRRGCSVDAFAEDADGITVTWSTADNGGQVRCAYLVGCDGGRSTIRKLAGFDFPGTPPTMTMYGAVVTLDHPERLNANGWRRTDAGVLSYGFLPHRLALLDFSGPPADRDAPVTPVELEAVLRRVSGADVRVLAIENASRWTDNTRLVDTYRLGRVLLAGDAAHIHTPFGGQGMSLGLADAVNLGWKLAAVVRGALPATLLDTYTAERRPAAEAVLANTRAQTAIMRPDPQSGALRDLMAQLLDNDAVNRTIGQMMTGLATRYDLGADPGTTRDDVGRLIADRPLGDSSLYGAMQDGAGVLLDASSDGAASAIAAARVRCIRVADGPSLLIRPDACVAWAADGDDVDGLQDALARWFPAP